MQRGVRVDHRAVGRVLSHLRSFHLQTPNLGKNPSSFDQKYTFVEVFSPPHGQWYGSCCLNIIPRIVMLEISPSLGGSQEGCEQCRFFRNGQRGQGRSPPSCYVSCSSMLTFVSKLFSFGHQHQCFICRCQNQLIVYLTILKSIPNWSCKHRERHQSKDSHLFLMFGSAPASRSSFTVSR